MATSAPALMPVPGELEFEAAFLSHGAYYRRVARNILGPEEAEDAVQEALLRAWIFRGSFRRESKLSTWIGEIVRMHCLGQLRGLRPVILPLLDRVPCREPDPIGRIYRHEQRLIVRNLLPSLSRVPRRFIERVLSGDNPGARTGADKLARHHAVVILRERVSGMLREKAYGAAA